MQPPTSAPNCTSPLARRALRLVDVARLGLEQRALLVDGLLLIPESLRRAGDAALIDELVAELELVAALVTEQPMPMSQVAA